MITTRPIEEEIKTSYLEYAMSVIVSRAIPDARDGLKPVQRRILYSMNELGVTHKNPYKKSARIVGETMGKYHPHGEMAIYDTVAKMARDFSTRYPLIDGQGNFGSIDGDGPAAMRYTEARMSELSEYMLADIDKDTVPFRLNFDGSLEEPEYLPTMIPQLLLNGTSGIAVGMATNMLPHNLTEIGGAIIHLTENPDCSLEDLLQYVKGPDFPTGGTAFFGSGLISSYRTGRGSVRIRGEVSLKEDKRIIIESVPYGVNKSSLVESIANLVKSGVLVGISDIRDESNRLGIRIVLKVRSNDIRDLIVNQLYERTQLEKSIGITNLVLLDGVPRIFGLKDLLRIFIDHRLEIISRRSQFELARSRKREHILAGMEIALTNIDSVLKIIRRSKDPGTAKVDLKREFDFSDEQAAAILDMRLQKLTSLEVESVRRELSELKIKIDHLEDIIANESTRKRILIEEMQEIISKFGDKRRTRIIEGEGRSRTIEELIPNEETVIILTDSDMIKRVSMDVYRSQRRGGKGVLGTRRREDIITSTLPCMTHDTILCFTDQGNVYSLKAYEIEQRGRTSNGVHVTSILKLREGERVKRIVKQTNNLKEDIAIVTAGGKIKKIGARHLKKIRRNGIRVISLPENDQVVSVFPVTEDSKIFVATGDSRGVLFNSSEIRTMGRSAVGVKAIKVKPGGRVISSFPLRDEKYILSVTSRGLAKRTNISDFSVHHRGGWGIRIHRISNRTGELVSVLPVSEDDEVLVVSQENLIRTSVRDISIHSRNAAGVKIMQLDKDDRVVTFSIIKRSD